MRNPIPINRDNNFDILRLFAAFMVFFSHSLRYFAISKTYPMEVLTGHDRLSTLGVICFFVISGFLVTRSFYRCNSSLSYLKNRVLRIFPALIVFLLIMVFILGPIFTTLNISQYFSSSRTYLYLLNAFLYPLQTVLPGLFAHNPRAYTVNGSIWTLAIEFSAYLMLLLAIKKKYIKYVLIAAPILFLPIYLRNHGTNALLYHYGKINNVHFFWLYMNLAGLSRFTIFFMLGGALNWISPKLITNKKIFYLCIIVFIASWHSHLYLIVQFITLPFIIIYIGLKTCGLSRFYRKIGDLSYGFYIYDAPLQQICWLISGGSYPYLAASASFILSLVAGLFSWRWVEKPFLSLKKESLRSLLVSTQQAA